MNRRKPPPPMPPHRASDPEAGLTVIRQYPPWAVVSALATLIFASGGLYWKIDSIAQGQQSISQSVAEINKKIEVTNLTDAKHDLKLEDLDKRVTKLEAAR